MELEVVTPRRWAWVRRVRRWEGKGRVLGIGLRHGRPVEEKEIEWRNGQVAEEEVRFRHALLSGLAIVLVLLPQGRVK